MSIEKIIEILEETSLNSPQLKEFKYSRQALKIDEESGKNANNQINAINKILSERKATFYIHDFNSNNIIIKKIN